MKHILLALLEQKDGLTSQILSKLGVNAETVKIRDEDSVQRTPKASCESAQIYATLELPDLWIVLHTRLTGVLSARMEIVH
jgi:ATP-dependent Clp protease ATP-binding subunit ClpA